jgi:hypothetical protein
MSPTHYHDDFVAQDTAEDDSSFETGTAQPLSEAEIEDLLYGDGRSSEERLTLLRQLRDDVADREGDDVGDNDATPLLAEIDGRIAELSGDERQGEMPGALDIDPLAHSETLSPDSDEREELEAAEEASLDDEDDFFDEDDDTPGDTVH